MEISAWWGGEEHGSILIKLKTPPPLKFLHGVKSVHVLFFKQLQNIGKTFNANQMKDFFEKNVANSPDFSGIFFWNLHT